MEDCFFFYRAGLHCLLAKNERSKEWYGFAGFLPEHPWYGSTYKRIKNIGISKMLINDSLDTVNSIYKSLWYMGFCTHPYSKDKTLEDLKELADNIRDELKKED